MDVIDSAADLPDGSPVAALRRQRPDFVRYGQGSHDVLITPAEPAGLSVAERTAIASLVSSIEGDAVLTEHYRALSSPADNSPRREAILRHVKLVTAAPGSATPAALAALRDAGLAPRDIVALTQIVAFVSYQVRVAAGLRALAREKAP